MYPDARFYSEPAIEWVQQGPKEKAKNPNTLSVFNVCMGGETELFMPAKRPMQMATRRCST